MAAKIAKYPVPASGDQPPVLPADMTAKTPSPVPPAVTVKPVAPSGG